jgi:hypothetical protein
MRRILMAGLLVLLALSAPTVVAAQSVHVSAAALAKIKAILATYPDGGPQLQAAIAAVVEADPTLASAVVLAAQTATTLQQQELGLGLAEAAAVLQDTGTPAGIAAANEIAQAVAIGPPARAQPALDARPEAARAGAHHGLAGEAKPRILAPGSGRCFAKGGGRRSSRDLVLG